MPAAVRKVDIPKPKGGVRSLGIPMVLDPLIQQALHQVMQPLFEPEFSESSYGFRPGRNAHQAVEAARSYVAEGKRWVVDLDLEKFFDRVNHDVLIMARVARKVKASAPALSNILLSDLDRELERRGHSFCRYAGDCNIYLGSQRSGQRVMAEITAFLE
jgi:RNA-directed DNA polymerase